MRRKTKTRQRAGFRAADNKESPVAQGLRRIFPDVSPKLLDADCFKNPAKFISNVKLLSNNLPRLQKAARRRLFAFTHLREEHED